MNTTEHLQRIKTKCQELLDIAEKRKEFPYKWEAHGNKVAFWWGDENHEGYWLKSPQLDNATALYIASCARAAEAGWQATIAAIDTLTLASSTLYVCNGQTQDAEQLNIITKGLNKIIAAWPEELL